MTLSPWATDRDRLAAVMAVYLVADPEQSASGDIVADATAALRGGATCVQLRAKHLSDLDAYTLAQQLVSLCRDHNVPFLINDRLDVALAVGADGLHVGLSDLPIDVVRRLSNDRLLIGWSPETDEQASAAASEGADYIGVGPVFVTGSKADAGEAIGLEALGRRARLAGIPSVGIGGISAERAAEVVAAGADGVAVISAILRSESPEQATLELVQTVSLALTRRDS